jgi:hypothetical protein
MPRRDADDMLAASGNVAACQPRSPDSAARCPDLVAPHPTPAQLTAIALASVTIGADREHPAAAWFTALAWPKAFNVIVRRPHLTNLHQSFDD